MILVVDASVALKWFFAARPDEEDADRALHLLEDAVSGRHWLIEPPHFVAEVAAVLARKQPQAARDELRDLLDIGFEIADELPVYHRALVLAARLGHHLFDTLYHAVALTRPGATLVTADSRYYERAHREGRIVMLDQFSH